MSAFISSLSRPVPVSYVHGPNASVARSSRSLKPGNANVRGREQLGFRAAWNGQQLARATVRPHSRPSDRNARDCRCQAEFARRHELGTSPAQINLFADSDEGRYRWDVLGLGQAMVDFSGSVSDEFLNNLHLVKGSRKVVNHEERGQVLQALDGRHYKLSAGGSLTNTLVALARLGKGDGFRVGLMGSIGSDPLGDFYRQKLSKAGVEILSDPIESSTTGTVVVLTTPDAQRTMLSYQGMSSTIHFDATMEANISRARTLIVEGYLWEIPQTISAIRHAVAIAKRHGVRVGLTLSDVSCVRKHKESLRSIVRDSVDVLFANADEARELTGAAEVEDALAELASHCGVVSITDGDSGAYLATQGNMVFVPSQKVTPVDTCGAGDAYAAGLLYSCLHCADLQQAGAMAADVARVVVGQHGARLKEEDAAMLAAVAAVRFRHSCEPQAL